MRTRFLQILAVVAVLWASSCKKEFHAGDTIEVVDTVAATNATTWSFSEGWGGSLPIGGQSSAWGLNDTLGGLRIPMTLIPGDRLIATLQVGLQQTGANGPCVDSLRATLGVVLGDAFAVTPDSPGVIPFEGGFSADSLWQQGDWVKQFTCQQELEVVADAPQAVVQSFARLRDMNGGCTAGSMSCYIMNRSLTLTVIHP